MTEPQEPNDYEKYMWACGEINRLRADKDELRARIAALEQAAALHSADVLQAHAQGVQDGLREAESHLAAARQRVEALGHQVADLHNALIQYGHHSYLCELTHHGDEYNEENKVRCDCGLWQAIMLAFVPDDAVAGEEKS